MNSCLTISHIVSSEVWKAVHRACIRLLQWTGFSGKFLSAQELAHFHGSGDVALRETGQTVQDICKNNKISAIRFYGAPGNLLQKWQDILILSTL